MKKLLVVVLVLSAVPVCLAEKPIRQDGQTRAASDALRVSDVLPTRLAEFVKQRGEDRVFDGPAELLRTLGNVDSDYRPLIELLRPSDSLLVAGPATLRETTATAKLERRTAKARTVLLAGTEVKLPDEGKIEFGEEVFPGDVIAKGLVINAGETDVLVETATGLSTLHPGEALIVSCASTCTVTCGKKHFACCFVTESGNCAHCDCLPSEGMEGCDAGGPGAVSCSVTAQ